MVIALFVDNNYNVENEILIQQPKAIVFDYVKSLRNQDKFLFLLPKQKFVGDSMVVWIILLI